MGGYLDERWDYIGSTIITNSYVRLTPDHQSRKGAIWNTAVSVSSSFTAIVVICYDLLWYLHNIYFDVCVVIGYVFY